MNQGITHRLQAMLAVGAMGMSGCASDGVTRAMSSGPATSSTSTIGQTNTVKPGIAPIPGGYWMYAFGVGQTYENFENVERAQYYYGIWSNERSWVGMGPSRRAFGNKLALRAYYPLHVRWKLKDGREFISENIDVAAIMREYFRTHSLQLQWQREGRQKPAVGEGSPTLTHEVKNDTVILKWVITINRTPVNQRLTSTGAATAWDTYDEEHVVTTIQGMPTQGIDFSKTRELR
ncbi:MAG: hypothetical protein U1E71_04700 [Ramlibacter sp.]|jgi:hypothetical protein